PFSLLSSSLTSVSSAHSLSLRLPSLFLQLPISFFFFSNDTATTEIYTLSLHDALPIFKSLNLSDLILMNGDTAFGVDTARACARSEEHTSELQSLTNLVCRLLLEKKKNPQTSGMKRKQFHF